MLEHSLSVLGNHSLLKDAGATLFLLLVLVAVVVVVARLRTMLRRLAPFAKRIGGLAGLVGATELAIVVLLSGILAYAVFALVLVVVLVVGLPIALTPAHSKRK